MVKNCVSKIGVGAHAAQGGVTLGPEQGELGANFCYLGRWGEEAVLGDDYACHEGEGALAYM
jgi:hypothetical protein